LKSPAGRICLAHSLKDDDMSETNDWRVTAGGDAEAGFLVDIHDGEHYGVYNPQVDSLAAAEAQAVQEHSARFHVARPSAAPPAGPASSPEPEQPAPPPEPVA
jgi:hypothetical protein